MQIHIQFQGNHVDLPIAYRHTQQGLIYHAISGDAEYSAQCHDTGYLAQARSFKLFTFSPFSGRYAIQGKRICFDDMFNMEVRSADERFIRLLAGSLTEGSAHQLANNPVAVSRVRVTDERLFVPEAHVQTLSPIVVYQTLEDGKTRFFAPNEPEFCAGIIRNARRKWESLHGADAPFALEARVTADIQPRKTPTTFKGTYITGWSCGLLLSGMPEVINMLYQTGLGAKSSQGFGMFRVRRG